MSLRREAVWLGIVLSIAGAWLFLRPARPTLNPSVQLGDRPLALPPPPEIDLGALVTVVDPDRIRSIDEPMFERASQAGSSMEPDEHVIGLVINGEARAYPINILSVHEIVNDMVGGEPVAITWCPLCFSALVFSRRIDHYSQPLTFAVSGKLLHNTLVMVDLDTGTLWSQLYGAGIQGQLAGVGLRVFPSLLTEWESWREKNPGAQVLSKRLTCQQFGCAGSGEGAQGVYATDPYQSYYHTPEFGVVNPQIIRGLEPLEGKRKVLGVRAGGLAKAYPFELLSQRQIINDMIGEVPVLIWFDPSTQAGGGFDRRLDGFELIFGSTLDDQGFLVDNNTGSQWELGSGVSVNGALQGEMLISLIATPAFEYGWYDHFPNSATFSMGDQP